MHATVLRQNWKLFTVVVIAQLCDLTTFLMGISRVGIGAERNVLVRHLFETYGAAGPLMLKVFTIAAVLSLLWIVASRWQDRILTPVLIAALVAMIGVYGNVTYGIVG